VDEAVVAVLQALRAILKRLIEVSIFNCTEWSRRQQRGELAKHIEHH
jgi:hypothetical protein